MKGIREFLLKANKAGYAAGDAAQKRKEADGSETIWFDDGDWSFHDNYFGGEPYGGREVVKYEGKVVWIMVYYGHVEQGHDLKKIYPFLQQALKEVPEEAPYRGPKIYGGLKLNAEDWKAIDPLHRDVPVTGDEESDLVYENHWTGDTDRFEGEEVISLIRYDGQKIEVYSAKYMGGLVDR